ALADTQINGITASVTATESVAGSTATTSDSVEVDHMAGSGGDDWQSGTSWNDSLVGGAGNDVLIGGQGNDILDGGAGADVLRWRLGETGTDNVLNFGSAAGTDTLDLRDLLVGETHGSTDPGNLASYLHFTTDGTNTTVSVNADAVSGIEQTIVLQGVNLVGSFTTDQQIIQDLLTKGKLVTD
ncbi:MAG TPA: type I secretion C-terminal target domain-containing protein, partial [Rhodocyclaceae bacterium]|nr:type I secretion C-terminal target domain-containing protein [Rhodocyclaceae bacterium]